MLALPFARPGDTIALTPTPTPSPSAAPAPSAYHCRPDPLRRRPLATDLVAANRDRLGNKLHNPTGATPRPSS
jgi:hypothetical protein